MYVAFIDHYDSFSINIVDWLIQGRFTVEHIEFDHSSLIERLLANPRPIVLSPGPGHPSQYHSTLQLIQALLGKVPILGICLGHQILGMINGLEIEKDDAPFHGTTQNIHWQISNGFRDQSTLGTSYNSLSVKLSDPLPIGIEVLACNDDGKAQCIQFCKAGWQFPALGVQFHPESFAGDDHSFIRQRFIDSVAKFFR